MNIGQIIFRIIYTLLIAAVLVAPWVRTAGGYNDNPSMCGWHDYGSGAVLFNEHCTTEQMDEISSYVTMKYFDKKYGGNEAKKHPIKFNNNGVHEWYEENGKLKTKWHPGNGGR